VGAGFSGLALAMRVPPSLKVLILEQKSQVDAGANTTGLITVATRGILSDLTDVRSYITNRIEDICVLAPDWSSHFFSGTDFPWIFSTDTPGLLGSMAGKLGPNVTLKTGARVETWDRETGEIHPIIVRFKEGDNSAVSVRCRLLVGADGTKSVVAAGSPDLSKNTKILFAYEKVFAGEPLFGEKPDRTVYHLWFGSFSLGYGGWIAPNFVSGKKVFRIGYATYDSNIKQENKLDNMINLLRWKEYIRLYEEKPLIKYGGYFPVGGVLPNTVSDDVILIGDAAGYCGAFSADGIKGALVSGITAAKLIPDHLDGDSQALKQIHNLMEAEAEMISYFSRQVRYRFLWNRMKSNATFTSLFKLCEREKDDFLNQFCDAKDMRKSLLWVLFKFRHMPALARLAGNILLDTLTGRK